MTDFYVTVFDAACLLGIIVCQHLALNEVWHQIDLLWAAQDKLEAWINIEIDHATENDDASN